MEILILIIYFLPSIIAISRKHNNRYSILVINIFLGWTFIGWIICLAMSLSSNIEQGK